MIIYGEISLETMQIGFRILYFLKVHLDFYIQLLVLYPVLDSFHS